MTAPDTSPARPAVTAQPDASTLDALTIARACLLLSRGDTRQMYDTALPLARQWGEHRWLDADRSHDDPWETIVTHSHSDCGHGSEDQVELDHHEIVLSLVKLVTEPGRYQARPATVERLRAVLTSEDYDAVEQAVADLRPEDCDALVQIAVFGDITHP